MICTKVFEEAFQCPEDTPGVTPIIIENEDVEYIINTCDVFIPHFYKPSNTTPLTLGLDTDRKTPDPVCVPRKITLQMLRDLVHALQTQWSHIRKSLDTCETPEHRIVLLEKVEMLVTQLFIWFGSYLFSTDIDEKDADDKDFVCANPPSHKLGLSECGIRFYLSIFFVLFRVLYIQRYAIYIPPKDSYPFEIESFHLEASIDVYHNLCMFSCLSPGKFLEYRHTYCGFYNNCSQVVYRHYPNYIRRMPLSISDVQSANCVEQEAVVSSLVQIYPETCFAYEDHHFEKQVGGGLKIAVLVSPPKKVAYREHVKKPDKTVSTRSNMNKPSEAMLLRIAACKTSTETKSAEKAVEGGLSIETIDFYWFVIGSEIHLVSVNAGEIFKGKCKDLLAHYLALKKT
ncbi:hypothetical protein T484DRAFT_1757016 [Baffinella frigidus]|nr:hypothetical protein T484DRAFT_1757016 [Cryptophyta sp. CCMP2293]